MRMCEHYNISLIQQQLVGANREPIMTILAPCLWMKNVTNFLSPEERFQCVDKLNEAGEKRLSVSSLEMIFE